MRAPVLIVALSLMLALPAWAQKAIGPHGEKAAIALTYDDALPSQLDIAIPQLDAAQLKGTFFLIGREIKGNLLRWKQASAGGHELGNHSVTHACPKALFPMPPQYMSENSSVAVQLTEIETMNNLLQAIDGRNEHAYATPCGQTLAGGEDYLPALRTARLTRYVRAAGEAGDGTAPIDPFVVPSRFFGQGDTGETMITYVDGIRRRGGVAVIGFHGVGGDYLEVTAEAHRQLLAWLQAHRSEVWVGGFTEVLDRATGKR
ncbi:MAG: polysaccharide deacetylase family protein [Paucibacter sp.]|nr:polysaccharide deacetylase family protein [Roseateles sp.]